MISEPLGIVLRSRPYHVDIASNGIEALAFCAKTTYDLILLDIMMPLCNGIEFLKQSSIKSTSPHTKVIVLSNLAGSKEIDQAMALGADKSLLKATITPRSLLELVEHELAG